VKRLGSQGKQSRRQNESRIRALLKRSQAGDDTARNELLRSHLGLVIKSAQQFHRRGAFLELQDLIQQGCLGLLRAMSKFDLNRKSKGRHVRFATYAVYWIQQAIRREIEKRGRLVALPANLQYLIAAYARKASERRASENPDDSVKNVEPRLGPSEKMAMNLWLAGQERLPLETFATSDDEPMVREIRSGDYYQDDPERLFYLINLGERLRHLIGALSERERFVLEHHYGMVEGAPAKSVRDLARAMRLTPGRVRQVRNRAIQRLRTLGATVFGEPDQKGQIRKAEK